MSKHDASWGSTNIMCVCDIIYLFTPGGSGGVGEVFFKSGGDINQVINKLRLKKKGRRFGGSKVANTKIVSIYY